MAVRMRLTCHGFVFSDQMPLVTASLRHTYLDAFFLDPEDIRVLGVGAIWNLARGTGLREPSREYGAQRACFKT
jgi:hypothetical protein